MHVKSRRGSRTKSYILVKGVKTIELNDNGTKIGCGGRQI